MKIAVQDRLEAVDPIAWDALHGRTRLRSPFLTWAWQSEWARAFATGHRLELWAVEDHGELVALLPLHETDDGAMELLGGADVSDYLDVVAVAGREDEVWSALLEARATAPAMWRLHAVPAASPTVTAVPGLAETYGLAVTAAVEERCPVLALPASWDAYLASLSGKQRHELTRKMRRLTREVAEARPTCAAEPAAIGARLDDFFALHRRSRVGKARFMDDRMEAFFRRALAALAGRGMARLWLLDTPMGSLAAFVTLEWNGVVGLYNSGFHPDHAGLSPGVVLLGHLVQDAIARSFRRFDFLRGEERYKYDFGPVPEDVYGVTIARGHP